MNEVCLVNKFVTSNETVYIFFNEVLSWLVTVSSNIVFKLYSDDASQFFKCFLINPFQPSIAFLQPMKTSNLKDFWCFVGAIEMQHWQEWVNHTKFC